MSQTVEIKGVGELVFPDEMTPEQIRAAISKKFPSPAAALGASRQPDLPPASPPGLAERAAGWLGETGRGLVTGVSRLATAADPALAAAGAAGSYLVPGTGEGSFGERWRNEMEGFRRGREESAAEAPVANVLGSLLPIVAAPQMLAAAPSISGSLAASAPLATRMAAGGIDAALFSGASAAGAEADRAPIEAGLEAAGSPLNYLGAAAPAVARAVPAATAALKEAALKSIPQALRAEVSPSAAALKKMGVEGLTLGQQAPTSPVGKIEAAAAERFGGMAPERAAAEGSWRAATLKRALPPGMTEVPAGPISKRLEAMYEGFEPAYAAVKAEKVYPAIHAKGKGIPLQGTKNTPGAFDAAVADPGVTATALERRVAKKFLDNELTLLPGGETRPGMVEPVSAGDLLQMRSNIRAEAASNRLSGQDKIARLLENGEEAVTRALETQLSAESAQALRAADKQYAQYKAVEKAAEKAGLWGEFTPYQLGQSLKAAGGGPKFARGAGGELRELAQHGEEVFRPFPKTGYAGMILEQLPVMKHLPQGVGTRLLNAPVIREALLRGAMPPRMPSPAASVPSTVKVLPSQVGYGEERLSSDESPGPDPVKVLTESVRSDPSSLGPYAADVAARLKEGGPEAVARWHYLQHAKDPQYRALVQRLGGTQ